MRLHDFVQEMQLVVAMQSRAVTEKEAADLLRMGREQAAGLLQRANTCPSGATVMKRLPG